MITSPPEFYERRIAELEAAAAALAADFSDSAIVKSQLIARQIRMYTMIWRRMVKPGGQIAWDWGL